MTTGEDGMKDFLVVAFGGNAIAPSGGRRTLEEQRENVRRMSAEMGRLILDGHRLVVTHGNGPQVGEIMLTSERSRESVPPVTLDVAGAMSQGQIGYVLQQEIGKFLHLNHVPATVCTLVTQVIVDEHDRAFSVPTKPIGRFYSKDEAEAVQAEQGWHMVEDAGRGYRRVVPSPMPQSIVEWPVIKTLVEAGTLVIAAGGGGVPVVRDEDGTLRGVEAVIDKDAAAQRLASLVGARTLALLTEVPQVALNFGTPQQRALGCVTVEELAAHASDGQFPPGSMGPKVGAALEFLRRGGRRAIITTPELLAEAVADSAVGTQVVASADAVPSLTGARGTKAGVHD
jgi:carbamate kinase